MLSKKISLILAITLIIMSLFGCSNNKPLFGNKQNADSNISLNKNNKNIDDADDAYYSIIQGDVHKEANEYLESYVRYPKIVRSTNMSDTLVDPINDEMTKEINDVITDMKNTAKITFNTYLNSSVENIKNDKEKRINSLKLKYKNIIGPDEVKAINNISSENPEKKATESIIIAFTTTEDLVNQGPHNKKIIVVETTDSEDEIKQTTIVVEGAPTIAPPSLNNSDLDQNDKIIFDENMISSNSNIRKKHFNKNNKIDKPIYEKPTETTIIEKESLNNEFLNESKNVDIVNAEIGAEVIDNNLTLESFYKELEEIKNIKIPSKNELINQYIKTYIDCSYQIMCLDEDYISLYIDITAYRTGNLINEKRIFKNIDIKNSKIVTLNDILGSDFKNKCIETIQEKIENLDDDFKKDLKPNYDLQNIINEKTPFFINNNHLPVVSLERNQITIGPVGYVSFTIKK